MSISFCASTETQQPRLFALDTPEGQKPGRANALPTCGGGMHLWRSAAYHRGLIKESWRPTPSGVVQQTVTTLHTAQVGSRVILNTEAPRQKRHKHKETEE